MGARPLVRTGAKEVWVCDLGGDSRGGTGAKSYKSGDANVFGIQVGVAIVWLVFDRDHPPSGGPVVRYRRIFGNKAKKLSALTGSFDVDSYQLITGEDLFVPVNWPPALAQSDVLPDLFRRDAFTGVQSARDKSDFSPWSVDRDGVYAEIPGKRGSKAPTLLGNLGRWAELSPAKRQATWSTAEKKRNKKSVPQPDTLDAKKVRKALYRPLDERYLYDDPEWIDWYRPDLHPVYENGPVPTLVTLPRDFGAGPLALHTCLIPEQHAFRGTAGGKGVYPLWVPAPGMPDDGRSVVNGRQYNLSDTVIDWATRVYAESADSLLDAYHYLLAVLSAPAYADRFWCELEAGPPRIPLTEDTALAIDLAEIGQQIRLAWDKEVSTEGLNWSGKGTGVLGEANYADGLLTFANGKTITGIPERAWRLTVSLYKVLPEWFAARKHWTATISQAGEALKTIAAAAHLVELSDELNPLFDRLIDGESWSETDDVKVLAASIGIDPAVLGEHGSNVLDLLKLAPQSNRYLVTRIEYPTLPDGLSGLLVPRTRIFFNVRKCKEFKGDVMVALAVYMSTQNMPHTFFATTARKVLDALTVLTEDEAEVVQVLIGIAGGNPYTCPVPESSLQAAYVEATVSLDKILDSLQEKGVIQKRRPHHVILTF